MRLRGVVPAGRREFRERLFRRHTWHGRGACRRFRTVICKNTIRGIDFDSGNASGIAAPAWPRPSRRVRRESKESTCRGRNQRADRLPVRSGCRSLTGYWWFILVGIACLWPAGATSAANTPMATTIWVRYSFSSFSGSSPTCGTMLPWPAQSRPKACSAAPTSASRRRGPVRQQPTRRRRRRPHGKRTQARIGGRTAVQRVGRATARGFCDYAAVRRRAVARRLYTASVDTPAMPTGNREDEPGGRRARCALPPAVAVGKKKVGRCHCARSPHWRAGAFVLNACQVGFMVSPQRIYDLCCVVIA